MTDKKILSLLSLATKAGQTRAGAFLTEKAVREGSAMVVILAGDASSNTEKKFRQMCHFYHVPLYTCSDKEELGHHMGKELRSVAAVTDEGFAKKIITLFESERYE